MEVLFPEGAENDNSVSQLGYIEHDIPVSELSGRKVIISL